MPPLQYKILHPSSARLSDSTEAALVKGLTKTYRQDPPTRRPIRASRRVRRRSRRPACSRGRASRGPGQGDRSVRSRSRWRGSASRRRAGRAGFRSASEPRGRRRSPCMLGGTGSRRRDRRDQPQQTAVRCAARMAPPARRSSASAGFPPGPSTSRLIRSAPSSDRCPRPEVDSLPPPQPPSAKRRRATQEPRDAPGTTSAPRDGGADARRKPLLATKQVASRPPDSWRFCR